MVCSELLGRLQWIRDQIYASPVLSSPDGSDDPREEIENMLDVTAILHEILRCALMLWSITNKGIVGCLGFRKK